MELVRNLPQQYRTDPWVLALADAILGVLEEQNTRSLEIRAQLSLETITWALETEERLAGIVPPDGATLESRRSVLAARYRSSGKVSIETIQAVADAWRNGEVEVSFPSGHILVKFVNSMGVPADLGDLQDALARLIPAHLACIYEYLYRTWLQAGAYTWGELSDRTWQELREGLLPNFVWQQAEELSWADLSGGTWKHPRT